MFSFTLLTYFCGAPSWKHKLPWTHLLIGTTPSSYNSVACRDHLDISRWWKLHEAGDCKRRVIIGHACPYPLLTWWIMNPLLSFWHRCRPLLIRLVILETKISYQILIPSLVRLIDYKRKILTGVIFQGKTKVFRLPCDGAPFLWKNKVMADPT